MRSRRVCCNAVAAPEAPPAKQQDSPIIMNGQVLHSITHERLELVRSLGTSGYLEKQVGRRTVQAMQGARCRASAAALRSRMRRT